MLSLPHFLLILLSSSFHLHHLLYRPVFFFLREKLNSRLLIFSGQFMIFWRGACAFLRFWKHYIGRIGYSWTRLHRRKHTFTLPLNFSTFPKSVPPIKQFTSTRIVPQQSTNTIFQHFFTFWPPKRSNHHVLSSLPTTRRRRRRGILHWQIKMQHTEMAAVPMTTSHSLWMTYKNVIS